MNRRAPLTWALTSAAFVPLAACNATEKAGDAGLSNAQVHYVELVCRDVAAQCAALEKLHGLTFGAAVADLRQARVAEAPDRSLIGVRAPLAPCSPTFPRDKATPARGRSTFSTTSRSVSGSSRQESRQVRRSITTLT